jgi:3-oxoacyl-[acyl-carrier-protein] synthase II
MKRRVVVTGLGLITACGNSVKENWDSLLAGQSGADLIRKFDTEKFDVKFACEVKNFDPLTLIEKREARRMGAFSHFAIFASDEALKHSGLVINESNEFDVGTYISSGIGDFWAIEREHEKLLNGGPNRVSPFFIVSAIVNLAAGNVSIRYGAKGPISATATACSAGAHAIGDSFRMIERGDAEAMICGGAESAITPMSVAGFSSMKAMSTNNADPKGASRPFDLNRDGFVIGEGSGILILEELEFAKKRGAKIYAEIVGYGNTSDAFHQTSPDETGSGAIRVMQKALKDAGITPDKIDYINAHGTSTFYNDRSETKAIKAVFGEHTKDLLVSSTKSMHGHALGAAGGIEAVISIMTLLNQKVPPTINYETPDPECDLDYVPNVARDAKVDYVLSNSFGFGGTNACLIFKKYDE